MPKYLPRQGVKRTLSSAQEVSVHDPYPHTMMVYLANAMLDVRNVPDIPEKQMKYGNKVFGFEMNDKQI